MKQILILMLILSCSNKKSYKNRYVIVIETVSKSILTGKEETKIRTDSVYAKDAVSAFDSAALEFYGFMVADSVLRDALHKSNNEKDYSYYKNEIKKVKIFDHLGNDISSSISDSIKQKIFNDYGIKPFE